MLVLPHDAISPIKNKNLIVLNESAPMKNLTISKQLLMLVAGFMLALVAISYFSVQSKMTSITLFISIDISIAFLMPNSAFFLQLKKLEMYQFNGTNLAKF